MIGVWLFGFFSPYSFEFMWEDAFKVSVPDRLKDSFPSYTELNKHLLNVCFLSEHVERL